MLSAGRVKLEFDREIAFGFGRYERSISRRTRGIYARVVESVNLLEARKVILELDSYALSFS